MSKHGHQDEEEEEEEDNNSNSNECFYESLDRILSSTTCSSSSCSSACSDNEDDDVGDRNWSGGCDYYALARPLPIPKFPMGVANNYDVWISRPSSVDERRMRLLRQMGLARHKPSLSSSSDAAVAKFGKFGFADQLGGRTHQVPSNSGIIRSKSADHEHCNSSSHLDPYHEILSINSFSPPVSDTLPTKTVINNVDNHIQIESRNRSSSLVVSSNASIPSKLIHRSEDIIICDDYTANNHPNLNITSNSEVAETALDSISNDAVCTIKNLDNGKEFVVDEVREDGMWEKLKEVGTGRHLTMEEFELCLGHSPIVQELMRRQNVEAGINNSPDMNTNRNRSKLKKQRSWLKSIKNVASSVTGHKEKPISDERDTYTSSEKGGRRSSSATDDSVSISPSPSVSFQGPERVRVRQYGKSCKDLTALYKTQEIQAHNGSIWTIKFTLDGKYLASAGEDCLIHIYQVVLSSDKKYDLLFEDGNLNVLSQELLLSSPNIQPEKKKKGRLSISRKSTSLDHIVMPDTIFSLSEKPFCSFKGHLDDVLDLSWSKSQHLLSSSMDKTVRLWELSSKSCLKIFSHNDYVTCIQFNPVDERYFISGSLDSKVRIWSIPDHQVVDWNDMKEMVTAASYTPDGQAAIVGSYKGSCCLYDTTENKLQQKSRINLQNNKKSRHKKITGFQFAPGTASEVLITSADSRIRVVDGINLVHKFKGFRNTNRQISASVTSNGRHVVCASEDSQVYIWKHEGDSRPSRKKGVTVTQSYEQFNCQNVSVAIPWPGITTESGGPHDDTSDHHLDEVATANSQLPPHPPTPEDEQMNGKESPFHGIISSASNAYFFDRFSATWPEEKLVRHTASVDFTKSKSGWGMVIVTAGIRGQIKTFQNFGLPVRI